MIRKRLFRSSFKLKGALSGLRQFMATESRLKTMKNTFYFTSKALFVLKIFKFLSWLFGHVVKRLDKKDKVNFKFYDVTAWLRNNRIHILPDISRSYKFYRRFYTVCFTCIPSWELLKRIETKLQTTFFYLISLFKK